MSTGERGKKGVWLFIGVHDIFILRVQAYHEYIFELFQLVKDVAIIAREFEKLV
jgi:hypothetical protein